jgi:hypothetical protein
VIELDFNHLHEDAVAIERVYFTKTDRRVNPTKVNPFIYLPGLLPILVSAPHSVRYIKQKKIRVSDEFTGATAILLNKLTGCHTLAVSKLYGGDPNSDSPCLYKHKLQDICNSEKIKLILDLHGCPREKEFDIGIISEGKKVLKVPLETIITTLQASGLPKVAENYGGLENNSITVFGNNQLSIPTFQLEVNKKFRVPHQNGNSYKAMLRALCQLIKLFQINHLMY